MHRRQFFVRSLGAPLLTLLWGCGQRTAYPPELLARPALLDGMEETTVRALGQRYLGMLGVPADRQERVLITRIAHAVGRARGLAWLPTPALRDVIAQDFARGHTVFVDGWLLSETEACQCALFARRG